MADPELDAMKTVHDALQELDEGARERVLSWAAAKFEVAGQAAAFRGPGQPTEEPEGSLEMRDVGDLVHAAQPNTGTEHALVVGYWLQETQGRDGWSGQELNNQLKNLGHGLTNVTTTLNALKSRKPALVMQTGKSGRSQQARKTYKLTTAGLREVRTMLSRPREGEAA